MRRRIVRMPDEEAAVDALQADALVSDLTGIPAFEMDDWLLVVVRPAQPGRGRSIGVYPRDPGEAAWDHSARFLADLGTAMRRLRA